MTLQKPGKAERQTGPDGGKGQKNQNLRAHLSACAVNKKQGGSKKQQSPIDIGIPIQAPLRHKIGAGILRSAFRVYKELNALGKFVNGKGQMNKLSRGGNGSGGKDFA